jgi:hypothetical protein
MPYPDHLERLKHISIDTLNLSESTLALLKWNGLTHVLDCIAFFYKTAQARNAGTPWSLLFTLMFAEVKPALITAGYWDLVLDDHVWQVFREQSYKPSRRMIVCWQGRDIDLYEIPLEQLGIPGTPRQGGIQFESVGQCLNMSLDIFKRDMKYWFEILKDRKPFREHRHFYEYLFGIAQPRLAELGYWAFVEAHIDDFDLEREINWKGWDRDDRLIDHEWPVVLVLIFYWIARALCEPIIRLIQLVAHATNGRWGERD